MAELRRSDKPDPSPNFVDHIFKEDPNGPKYRQWQSVDTFLVNYGAQLESSGGDSLHYGTVAPTGTSCHVLEHLPDSPASVARYV